MKKIIRLSLLFLCSYVESHTISPLLTQSIAACIQACPSLMILIPAYVLYADQNKLGLEPLDEFTTRRIHTILEQAGLHDLKNIACKKLNREYLLCHGNCDNLKKIIPLSTYNETIIALATPHALIVDEYACRHLSDEELRIHIVACALFIKHRVLEKTIMTALITPITTELGTRLLNHLVKITAEVICAEIAQSHPTLAMILCSSNKTLEWLLTNFVTKFILNTRIIHFMIQKHLQSIDTQANIILEQHNEKNSTPRAARNSKNSRWRSSRATCQYR